MQARDFGRLLTAMVTPFKEDLSVDYDAAAEVASLLVDSGSEGLVVSGTTGESPTLSSEEKLKLVEVVKAAVGDRARIMAGTCSNNTQGSIELTEKAEAVGADGILMVTPYYNRPPQEGLFQHFAAIARATSLPCTIYNVPGRTACNVEAETVLRCAEATPNIRGAKEASGQLGQITEVCRLTRDIEDFIVWSGNDADTLPVMAVGGYGIISVASHIVGREMATMVKLFAAGQVDEAARINQDISPVYQVLFPKTSVNPVPVKYALGLIMDQPVYYRQPLVPLDEKTAATVRKVMEGLGLLE